jgi:hypothetical protein
LKELTQVPNPTDRTSKQPAQPKRLGRRLLAFIKLQAVAVVVALLTVAGAANRHGFDVYELVSFAVPAPKRAQIPWEDEVGAFGHKVAEALGVRRSTAMEFAGWILEAAERQDLDPELMASLVLTESSFRKNVRSHVGAVGPAQIRPEFWSRFCGITNLQDPAENIYCGAQVLSHLRDRCGDEGCALQAYNIGYYGRRVNAGRRYVAKIDYYRDQLRNYPL